MVTSIGALCFGIVLGYVTYRTLVRTENSSVSDLGAVLAAIGGGTVTAVYDPASGDAFGWYAIGLLVGMACFLVLRLRLERTVGEGQPPPPRILGDGDRPATGGAGATTRWSAILGG